LEPLIVQSKYICITFIGHKGKHSKLKSLLQCAVPVNNEVLYDVSFSVFYTDWLTRHSLWVPYALCAQRQSSWRVVVLN